MKLPILLRSSLFAALLFMGGFGAEAEDKLIVKGPAQFRDISLQSWKGTPRLGMPDGKGLYGAIGGQELRAALQKNKPLADKLGRSLERHYYGLGLLANLDYMRVNADCFANMNKYKARTEFCAGRVIQHNMQLKPWNDYIKNIALSLSPPAHGKYFCPFVDGKPLCSATGIDQIRVKTSAGRSAPLDEFQRRDFFSSLMAEHFDNFENLWRNIQFPKEAWVVQVVRLSEYDFDKQHFVFTVSPVGSITSRPIPAPRPIGSYGSYKKGKNKKGQSSLTSRMLPLSPKYIPTGDFEKGSELAKSGGVVKVILPMNPAQARKLVQSNKRRAFFAVTKVRFLPRGKIGAERITGGAGQLAFHFAANKVELYRDSSLTGKVADIPLVKTTASPQAKTSGKDWQWAEGHKIFDGRAFALMRLNKADLADDKLQRLADSVAQNERRLWMKYDRRLKELDREAPPTVSEGQQQAAAIRKKQAEDRAKLSHVNWQQMTGSQRNILYDYMLGTGDKPNEWPDSFPAVSWGINAATIFKKGHFSDDPTLAHLPATSEDKAILQQFLKGIAQSYPTDKLTLVYDLRDTQYDTQSKAIKLSSRYWPFHPRPALNFDDNKEQKFTSAAASLVNAAAKSRAIYHFSISTAPLGSHIPGPRVDACKRNDKRQSEDCVTSYGQFLQVNWPGTSFAFDRTLPLPELKMDAVRGTGLINSATRGGPGWRLVVELEKVDMKLSPYIYKPKYKKETAKGEAQTIFASVMNAYILAPNGAKIWQAGRDSLVAPVDRSILTNDQTDKFSWDSSVRIFDNSHMDRVIYDLLYVKYYPDLLDQRYLEAMFSSRWTYEKSAKNPTGGRFFNIEARRPTWQDVQKSLPKFRQWLTERAKAMPGNFNVRVPLRYANNTVNFQNQCIKFKLAPNSPLRNSGSAKILADAKVRQCQTTENQAKSQFQRCESLRRDLNEAETALAETRKGGCTQTVKSQPDDNIEIAATGSCDFSNIEFSKMQSAMQACMAERCGPTPTTMAGMGSFQKCVQAVSGEMQDQLRAAMGGGKSKPKSQARDQIVDSCKPHQRVIRDTKQSLRSFRCEKRLVAPVAANCSVLGKIPTVSHMHVEQLLFEQQSYCGAPAYHRKSNSSAELLPFARPYSDTHLKLQMAIGKLEIPYDPPFSANLPANGEIELDLEIQSVEASNRKGEMKLRAKVRKSDIKPKK